MCLSWPVWRSTTALQVSTLFPSPKTEEGVKGGVILLRQAHSPGLLLQRLPSRS